MRRRISWWPPFVTLLFIPLLVLAIFGGRGITLFQPPEARALNLFQNFRDDSLATARSIDNDKIRFIDRHGVVNPQGRDIHVVAEYRNLTQETGGD
jgi:hypothetical protein